MKRVLKAYGYNAYEIYYFVGSWCLRIVDRKLQSTLRRKLLCNINNELWRSINKFVDKESINL